ncbi:SAM-dependent methyltransferase [Sphingomonas arenae]|uniref:SAM-dependent methyltransferase n=1 Tax=Sphingomonas arenae TaxID=2812555 RepID=UPI001966DBCA|nr:SAM-dependent methyltransferase [Sphingomonas arenae]
MSQPLFDEAARALRRQRALRKGPVLFLAERAVEDLQDRLSFIQRRFRRALLIGLADASWTERFSVSAEELVSISNLEELVSVEPGSFDLCVVLGQLETTNELPLFLRVIRATLESNGLAVGAFPGNESLPVLRSVMLAADQATGSGVSPRVHPRVEASAFAGLLQDAGFTMPVVDIDRVRLRYRRFDDLIRDLRGMGATNVLLSRAPRPLGRAALNAARQAFAKLGDESGTMETVEIINFAAWTPASGESW